MKLYEAVARTLLELGVHRLFGVMGDANMRYLAAYADAGEGAYVAAHEAGAVAMADGYSRMTAGVGVAAITHGPGVTNGLTALTEAVRSGSALVVLTGSTPPQRRHNQWLDLRAAARLAGAGFSAVQTPASAVEDIVRAVRTCALTRRPVVVDIPADIMSAEVGRCVAGFGLWPQPRPAPDDEQFDAAIGVIASARRPLILAGRGALLSGAHDEVTALAEALHAPLTTSVMAMSFAGDYPLHLGIFGSESHSLAIRYIAQADCVIVLGAGLNDYTTADGDLLRDKAVVRCDSSPVAVAAGDSAWISVLSDVRIFARKVTEALAEIGGTDDTAWARRLRQDLDAFNPADDFVDASAPNYVDLRAAMIALDAVLPGRRALVTDVGRFKTAPWRHLRCSEGAFTQSGSFSAIGLGLPMAIGAAFAHPDMPTVGVVGDGGLMMSIAELATAVEHRLPLVLAVANDSAYGAEYLKLQQYGHAPEHSLRAWPSFAAVAAAFGADSEVITAVDQIRPLEPRLRARARPLVLDIRMDSRVNVRRYR